jgi:hypothetical protein
MSAAIVLLATLVVFGLFVHIARRSDVLEDVLAEPLSGEGAVTPLVAATTTLPLSRTPVRRAGDVAVRLSVSGGRPVESSLTMRVLGQGREQLATCRYASGSLIDSSTMRCPVRDLAPAQRVAITVTPKARNVAVVGNAAGVGRLLVPRGHSLLARLRTVFGRIGARHPVPFTGWIVPIGTILWLSGLAGVALSVARPRRRQVADDAGGDDL